MSRPVLEIVIEAVLIIDQKGVAAVTESPIKAGVRSSERAEGKRISSFLRGLRDNFGVRD